MGAQIVASQRVGQGRGVRRIGGGLVALALLVAGAAAQESQEYVRAKAGAVLRNFQDPQGKEFLRPTEGALLRVHEKSRLSGSGDHEVVWLKVSAPAGLPVWVYGQYLDKTSVEGVLRVNANAIRMRPLPDSSVASYPIKDDKLFRGDRVQFIERNDPSTSWATDWVKVWSPSTAKVWVDAAQTTPEPNTSGATAEWQASARVLPVPVVASTPAAGGSNTVANSSSAGDPAASGAQDVIPAPASAKRPIPEEAYKSLAFGNTLLNKALALGQTAQVKDFDASIRAYKIVLDIAPGGSTVASNATRQLQTAEAHAAAASVREGIVASEERRVREYDALREEQERVELASTAHWGRFSGRGWVVSKTVGRQITWYLKWGGEIRFEVECRSGRYDLALFDGYEVGIIGSTIRDQSLATEERQALVAMLDVTRLEVISAGVRGR